MVDVNPTLQAEYRAAWESWQQQLAALHRTFLDGEPRDAPQLKGLLNREARAKAHYDRARRVLLGIAADVPAEGSDPAPP